MSERMRDFLPDEAALRQLEEVAALAGVQRYITVLPDVHHKAGNPSPSGTVVVTSGVILPRAIDDVCVVRPGSDSTFQRPAARRRRVLARPVVRVRPLAALKG